MKANLRFVVAFLLGLVCGIVFEGWQRQAAFNKLRDRIDAQLNQLEARLGP